MRARFSSFAKKATPECSTRTRPPTRPKGASSRGVRGSRRRWRWVIAASRSSPVRCACWIARPEIALLSTDRYALRALAFDGDELLGVDARGTLSRWRLDRPERESEPTPITDPRHLRVDGDTLVVIGAREVWVRRGERQGSYALDEGQVAGGVGGLDS